MLDFVKKIMPVWKTYEELSDYVEKEEESMAEVIDIIGNYKDKEGNPVVIVSKF